MSWFSRGALAAIALVLVTAVSGVAAMQNTATTVAYAPIPAGTYNIDPAHSVIGFSIRHFELSWVSGRFKDFVGTITIDDKDMTKSSVTFTAKIASVDTGIGKRDDHLRTADFFEAEKYPELTFKSSKIERKSGNDYVAHGDLTIKGVTKQIALPFTLSGAIKDQRGGSKIGVDAQTTVNRLDFGIGQDAPLPAGGAAIGNEVRIEISLEAALQAPKS